MNFSSIILPVIVLLIIVYGVIKKVPVYDTFIEGAKDGFKTSIEIFPYTLAMLTAVGIFVKSNILVDVLEPLKNILTFLKVPVEVIPLAIMKPISGGAALGILNDIFSVSGPDSLIGRMASVIQGCSDTTIYIISLYFGTVGVKKIRYAMWVGLLSDLVGVILSITLVSLVFG